MVLDTLNTTPNLIPDGCTEITPQMLHLVSLEPGEIRRIAAAVPGGHVNIQDIYPLVPLQEGIVFRHMLGRRGGSYVSSILLEFESSSAFQSFVVALQHVVDRHDILRTAILCEGLPRPLQVVYRRAHVVTEELHVDGDPVQQLKDLMRLERQQLNLDSAPLLRLRVVTDVTRDRSYALLQFHHAVSDGTFFETVIAELKSCLEGRAALLPQPMPYRLHVARIIDDAARCDAESFFRKILCDVREPTAPFGLLDLQSEGARFSAASIMLDATMGERLRAQARHARVSMATLFHVACALVVTHTTGRDDIVFGTVLFGRPQIRYRAQQKLGMFLNTVPVRLRLQGVGVTQLLKQAQQQLLELLFHEHASLALARRCCDIVGSEPLFSVLFNYRQRDRRPRAEWSDLPGVRLLAGTGSSTGYPITLSVDDFGTALTLTAETDERIDPQRIVQYLQTAALSLLEALETAPESPALALSILPAGELHEVLESFNATRTAPPRHQLIHQPFEERAQCCPEAVALIHGGQQMTYGVLNRRANQLARFLRGRGVGPDRVVALCVERGPQMVVGLLGILKAGGAYMPLDPAYPSSRLAYMLEDAAPCVILTQTMFWGSLPASSVDLLVALDDDANGISLQEEGNVDPHPTPLTGQHLAYVIYTSGSTGVPKAVAAEHRGMVNRIEAQSGIDPFRSDDICCQKTSVAFVDSLFEILGPLSNGRPLVLASGTAVKDPGQLALLIERERVSRLITVPSLARALVESDDASRLRSLRSWTLSGEELSGELLQKLRRRLPDCRVVNLYGSSEVAADATWFSEADFTGESVPIGRPISNMRVYVLDQNLWPAPIGVAGEIYVGGPGVARGYLNQPALTADRFVADPFTSYPGSRLYKSGDLGRWKEDGQLEYLGRGDRQVKLRGVRVELGEIEARLLRHDLVVEAVVTVREDTPGEPRLVAYYTHRRGVDLRPEELRAHIAESLPEYSIPGALVALEQMPQTPSGKLDRRALPRPDSAAYVHHEFEAPRPGTEERVAAIWQNLLGVPRIGRDDNFFELGGHSLQAMRLVRQIAEELRVSLPLVALFEHSTVRKITKIIEAMSVMNSAPSQPNSPDLVQGAI